MTLLSRTCSPPQPQPQPQPGTIYCLQPGLQDTLSAPVTLWVINQLTGESTVSVQSIPFLHGSIFFFFFYIPLFLISIVALSTPQVRYGYEWVMGTENRWFSYLATVSERS